MAVYISYTKVVARMGEFVLGWNRLKVVSFRACTLMVALLLLAILNSPLYSAAQSNTENFAKRYDLPRDPSPLVKEILARSEFNEDFSASLIDELRAFILEQMRRALRWLSKHFPRLPRVDVDPAPVWWIVEFLLIGALLVVGIVVARIAVKYLVSRKGKRPKKTSDSPSEEAAFMGSEEALGAARTMAAESRFTEALIFLFRFVLLRLDERGTVTLRPGKTNREILRSVPDNDPIKQPLSQMMLLFNRVRYGNEACNRVAFDRFVSLSRRVTGGA